MRRKVINKGRLSINLQDNAKNLAWGWKKVINIVEDSMIELENFLFSNKTLLTKSKHSLIKLDVTFCGDQKIRTLNKQYRNKDKATDVLSFPVFESLRRESSEFVFPGPVHLGDIVISRDVAARQAKEFDIEIEQEIIHLLVHGFLHLQGWDHEISVKEEQIMEALEQSILNKIRSKRKK